MIAGVPNNNLFTDKGEEHESNKEVEHEYDLTRLSGDVVKLETLWDQKNPDPEKVKALSNRISELRGELDRKQDDYLTQCRQEFGDRGWSCPGGNRRGY